MRDGMPRNGARRVGRHELCRKAKTGREGESFPTVFREKRTDLCIFACMTRQDNRWIRIVEVAAHTLIWVYVFATPLLFRRGSQAIDWYGYVRFLYFPLSSCLLFYANYLWLVPRFLQAKRYREFVFYNVLLLTGLTVSREFYIEWFQPPFRADGHRMRHVGHTARQTFRLMPMVRGLVSLLSVTFLAIVVRLSMLWHRTEAARQEAELGRAEAELKNMKSQINPHFLLNTLNNIYALTTFDTRKAQEAIEELGKLLRYVLYENQEKLVGLRQEADFLQTYIALMRLRLSDTTEVKTVFRVPSGGRPEVAPLIFISLVENAFKHGVSPTQASFIHISLTAEPGCIRFVCRNSNFPKSGNDKSPGGIGLQQVRNRLEHAYPGRYEWRCGTEENGGVYYSEIHIYPTKTGG